MEVRRALVLLAATSSVMVGGADSVSAQPAVSYHVTVLGALPGKADCRPAALNDSGVVVGYCQTTGMPDYVAVRWTGGAAASLGTLPAGHYSNGTAINSLGTVVGSADDGDFRPDGFVSTGAGLFDFASIGGGNVNPIGITETGVIFVSQTKSLSGWVNSWDVVMWAPEPGRPDRYRDTKLPRLRGNDRKLDGVYANASNKLGQVVGWVSNDIIGGQVGAFWNNEPAHSIVALPALPGAGHSIALGVNDLGQAVGYSDSTSGSRAVVWQNDDTHTIVDLGTLPGDAVSFATGINAAGQVVGLSSANARRVFLYTDGAMHDLATLIDPADGTWSLDDAIAINNAGQVLAIGFSGGVAKPIVLTPVAQ